MNGAPIDIHAVEAICEGALLAVGLFLIAFALWLSRSTAHRSDEPNPIQCEGDNG